jgi:hypothetical protein
MDLNFKLFILGKLLKVDGSDVDETDFTAVTNNFLHSLSNQSNEGLNGTTITQAL